MIKDNIIKKATVLVVDAGNDDSLSREVAEILGNRVKDIKFARNAEDGMRLFMEFSPQIVILDIQHSQSKIVDFSFKIKSVNYNAELVVILGFVEPHKLIELIDLDIRRFVIKPVTVPKLTDAVSKAMESVVEKAISNNYKYMQEMLNAEDTPVFSTDGKCVMKANKAFLDCFGAKTLSQFCLAYPDLRAVFGISDEESMGAEYWFKDFLETGEEPKAMIYDNRVGDKRVFLFRPGNCGFDKNCFVVTMTDITDMEVSFEKKLESISSQMLSKEKLRFRSLLEFEVARCKRYKKVFSIIAAKFDIQQEFVTEAWDSIFKVARHTLRSSDLFAKVDSNQLAIIATETDINGANVVVDRLKKEFEKLENENGHNIGFKGCATEFNEKDSAQSIFARVASCVA